MLFLIVAHAAQSQILVPTMIGAMQLLQLALGPMSTTKGNTKGFTRTLLHIFSVPTSLGMANSSQNEHSLC